MATILTKKSDTASAVPGSGDLTNSTGGAELAVNTADKRLFTKTSGGTVVEVGTNPSTLTTATLSVTGNTTLGDASGDSVTINASTVSTPNGLNFDSNTLVIDAANNRVGIGTASPDTSLTILKNSNADFSSQAALKASALQTFSNTQTTTAVVFNGASGNPDKFIAVDTQGGTQFFTLGYQNGSTRRDVIQFTQNDTIRFSTAGSERMRIDTSGNVGIGTSSPYQSSALDVSRTDSSTYASSGAGAFPFTAGGAVTTLSNLDAGDGRAVYLNFRTTNAALSTNLNYIASISTSGSVSPSLAFGARTSSGYAERLRIDSSGNLGLGVTPSAWDASIKAIEGNNGSIVFNPSYTQVSQNAYYNGTSWIYKSTGVATNYNQFNGQHIWRTATSGTAGNAISFTQAMTLDASGRLGIGTSSFAAKLQVATTALSPTTVGAGIRVYDTTNNYGLNIGSSGSYGWIQGLRGVTSTDGYNDLVLQPNGGNVGIGTSSPQSALSFATGAHIGVATVDGSDNGKISIGGGGAGTTSRGAVIELSGNEDTAAGILELNSGNVANSYVKIQGRSSTSYVRFDTNATERMRIDSSGNLLIGKTTQSYGTAGIYISPTGDVQISRTASGAENIALNRTTTGNFVYLSYGAGATQVGTISTNGTTTTYGTSSDYRLKENIAPMTGALATVAQLNPVTYNWKADGSAGQGFIAHELQAVVPDCVTGEKDAVDADGKPVYQGIDTSFLVATLTKAIQEQQAIIESLKSRLDAAGL